MSAIEVELHRKLGVKKPCPPSVELEQIRSNEPIDLLVSGGEGRWWSVEVVLKRGQPVHVEALSGEPTGKAAIPTSLVPIGGQGHGGG